MLGSSGNGSLQRPRDQSTGFAKRPRLPAPQGGTAFGNRAPGAESALSGRTRSCRCLQQVSAAGPWARPTLRVTHRPTRLVWGHEAGTRGNGLVVQHRRPGGASRWGGARWCTSAWGRRTWRSCWPECSDSPLQTRAANRPAAGARAGAAAGAARP